MTIEGKRIFVVEDDAYNLGIILSLLQQNGAIVDFDGWGALTIPKLMRFKPVDLILLDLMLPNNVSGYDVFDKIRAMRRMVNVPIAIVSASDPDIEMKKARKKGFCGYISKPIRFNTFPKFVSALLDGKEVWGELD